MPVYWGPEMTTTATTRANPRKMSFIRARDNECRFRLEVGCDGPLYTPVAGPSQWFGREGDVKLLVFMRLAVDRLFVTIDLCKVYSY